MSSISQPKDTQSLPENLRNRDCKPCAKDAEPLSQKEAGEKMASVPGWELLEDGKAMHRYFEFKNFKTALNFVNLVGEIAEIEKHHPDISVGWGYVDTRMQTHSIGGLHENDYIMASKINALYQGTN